MFWNFRRWKTRSFLAKKLIEIWYLLITEKFLFWTLRRWEIRYSFEPKSWWKDDIHWVLKSSSFELFQDGKYGLFLSQKVDERWCLLINEKFVFWTFRWLEIRSFFQLKSLWKDNIYLVVLNFHDNPGLRKYSFLCSETLQQYKIK